MNERCKIIKMLINGNDQYKGRIMSITKNRFPNFNVFLDQLTAYFKSVMPNGVRRIYRFGSFQMIHRLEDLENYGSYICCSNEGLKRMAYDSNFIEKQFLTPWEKRNLRRNTLRTSQRDQSPELFTNHYGDYRQDKELKRESVQRSVKEKTRPKLVRIVYNDKPQDVKKLFVNRNLNMSLQEFLYHISVNVNRKIHKNEKIKLYTASGHEINNIDEFYLNRSPLLAFTNPILMDPNEVKEMIINLFPERRRAERYFHKWMIDTADSELSSHSIRLPTARSNSTQSNQSKERLMKTENYNPTSDNGLSNREREYINKINYRQSEIEKIENDKIKTNINYQRNQHQSRANKYPDHSIVPANDSVRSHFNDMQTQVSLKMAQSDKITQFSTRTIHSQKVTHVFHNAKHFDKVTNGFSNTKYADRMLHVSSNMNHADKMLHVSINVEHADKMLNVSSNIENADKMVQVSHDLEPEIKIPSVEHHHKLIHVSQKIITMSSGVFGENYPIKQAAITDEKSVQCSRNNSHIDRYKTPDTLDELSSLEEPDFFLSSKYKVIRVLSESMRSKVYLSRQAGATNVVIKRVFLLEKYTDRENEAQIIMACRNDNIIRCIELLRNDSYIEIVMEYMPQGNIERYLAEQPINEEDIIQLVKCVANGLLYMHSVGLVHRQIIPENIYLSSNPLEFKIGDMSHAIEYHDILFTEEIGDRIYAAPELLLHKSYNEKIDIWSLGVIINNVVCDKYRNPTLTNEFKFQTNHPNWTKWDPQCKMIVSDMLKADPSQRCSALDILCHRWLLESPKTNDYLRQELLQKMESYKIDFNDNQIN